MAEAVVRFKPHAWALGQDQSGPRDPIRFFPVDQVAEVIERAKGVRTFGPVCPCLGDILKEGSESTRGATKDVDGEVEAEFHDGNE
jgi:hypothetical protein